MAKNKIEVSKPAIDPVKGIELIKDQIGKAKALRQTQITDAVYEAWRTTLHDLLRNVFGKNNETVNSIVSAGNCYGAAFGGYDEYNQIEERKEKLEALVHYLENAIEQLNLRVVAVPSEKVKPVDPKGKNAVFIVHGHAEGLREKVARLLQEQGIKPIILAEAENEGLTVIEKLEKQANIVGYAIVLLTSDDLGCSKAEAPQGMAPRARQNVILEMGFFIAKLGRERVCILREQDVNIPSDVTGVVYTDIDSGDAWKLRVGKELRHVGFSFDLNKV